MVLRGKQHSLENFHEKVFIVSSIIFNFLISTVYISTKFDNMELVKNLGYPFTSLIIPFGYTLYKFIKNKDERRVIASNAVILVYLFMELLFDIILDIPFREILWLHIIYVLVFYAAEFSIIGVSFNLERKRGFIVLFTFMILLGCLIYLYLGWLLFLLAALSMILSILFVNRFFVAFTNWKLLMSRSRSSPCKSWIKDAMVITYSLTHLYND